MGLFSRRKPETRAAPFGDSSIPPNSLATGAVGAAGVFVNEQAALQQATVFACCRIISQAVAQMPVDAYRRLGGVDQIMPSNPPVIDDPFGPDVLRRVGIQQMILSLLLRGNSFNYIADYDGNGRPNLLVTVHPDAVSAKQDKTTGALTYRIGGTPVPAARVMHIPGLTLPGSRIGMSVIDYHRMAIGLGIATEQFGSKFFLRGAAMSGVIEVDDDLEPDEARKLKASFTEANTGLNNAHAVGVLSGGATFRPISITPDDAQFLQTRDFQRSELAMIFGVPPHMLGIVDRTTSWGTGIEQQSLGFLRYTLEYWVGLFEDAFSRMLPRPQFARFDRRVLLRTDAQARAIYHQTMRTIGAETINEVRVDEGRVPLDDPRADDAFQPLASSIKTATDAPPSDQTPAAAADSGAPQ